MSPLTRSQTSTTRFAPPRWGTERTDRPTDGPVVAEAVRRLWGRELFAWQRHVLDVVGERLPGTGDPGDPTTWQHAYDTVILVVGRRAGKSIGAMAQDWTYATYPRLWRPDVDVWRSAYTAQNATAAQRRLADTWEMFSETASPAQRRSARLLRGVNHASVEVRWRGRGPREVNPRRSRIAVFPPTRHSLRGDEYRAVKVDEVTTLDVAEGQGLSDAIRPALAAVEGQLWWLSNLALGDAGWLPVLMARGRDAVESGRTDGVAYFEWSAPDGADVADPDVWAAAHPAVGDVLSVARMRRELEESVATGGPERFAAEYLNMAGVAAGRAVDAVTWQRAQDATLTLPREAAWLAVDVAADRRSACVAAGWAEGRRMCAGVLWTGTPADVAAVLPGLVDRWRPRGVVYDPVVAGAVAEPWWQALTAGEYVQAVARILDLLAAGTVAVMPDPALDAAVAGAVLRQVGDGAVWSRRRSELDVVPLVAVTLATFAARVRAAPVLV